VVPEGGRTWQEAVARLKGQPRPAGAYTYVPPAAPAPAPQPPKEKPRRGGLFGFFKK